MGIFDRAKEAVDGHAEEHRNNASAAESTPEQTDDRDTALPLSGQYGDEITEDRADPQAEGDSP